MKLPSQTIEGAGLGYSERAERTNKGDTLVSERERMPQFPLHPYSRQEEVVQLGEEAEGGIALLRSLRLMILIPESPEPAWHAPGQMR